ncbi:MAG: hypothetical protein ABI878_13730 [Acidobacteriota bacterium]
MNAKRSGWRPKLIAFLVSCLMIAMLLGAGELYCRWFTKINFLDSSVGLFTANRFGDSYGNTPNYKGESFGEVFYTDANGFRIEPEFRSTAASDAPAILIVGDSVSFGPAMRDDLTIAGHLRRSLPNERIYNSSAIGYDATSYRNVVATLIPQRPEVKSVLLFYCLNDLTDVSAADIKSQINDNGEIYATTDTSPLRTINDYLRSRSKLYLWLKNALRDTQLIYFQNDLASYQKSDKYLQDGLRPLAEIKEQLDLAGVSLKVFVLPYEAQLRKNTPPDLLVPQQKVDNFLKQNHIEFFDLTQDLQSSGDTHSLFLYGDPMHLSEKGHELVAKKVCATIPDCKP